MTNKIRLLIAGNYPDNEGYPNNKYRLEALRNSPYFLTIEINVNNDKNIHLAKSKRKFIFLLSTLKLAKLLINRNLNPQVIYTPYPSIISNYILRVRFPNIPIISDAFISLYDTMIIETEVTTGAIGKILFYIEKYSFKCCNKIMVDTPLNIEYLASQFGLKRELYFSSPLYTFEKDADTGNHCRPKINDATQVFFVGNTSPLHGMETILSAIDILRDNNNIKFKIFGGNNIKDIIGNRFSKTPNNLIVSDKWEDEKTIADEITSSDICLGIFSNSEKANRVCPYKIYLYCYFGKAVITGRTEWVDKFSNNSFLSIKPENADDLACAILEIHNSIELKRQLEKKSKLFYELNLRNEIAHSAFYKQAVSLSK